jgi:hypothetical protein
MAPVVPTSHVASDACDAAIAGKLPVLSCRSSWCAENI